MPAQTGGNYYSYPVEYHDQIKSYIKPGADAPGAVFKIMDAIYNHQDYKIKAKPVLVGSDLVWNYQVKSPVLKETLYITGERKTLTQEPGRSDDSSDIKRAIEYQISVGELYTLRATGGILHYLSQQICQPVSKQWLQDNSDKFVGVQQAKQKKLLEIGNSLTK